MVPDGSLVSQEDSFTCEKCTFDGRALSPYKRLTVLTHQLRTAQTRKRRTTGKSSRQTEGNLRKRLLDAARKLLFSEGPLGITARKVAAEAGCSATAIYIHYQNLDHLLFALRLEGHALLARYLRAEMSKGKTWARMRGGGRAYFRFGLENPAYYDLMFLARAGRSPVPEQVQQEMYTLMMLHEVVVSGIEQGEIRPQRDTMATTNAVWAQVHGVTSLAVQGLLVHTAPHGPQQILTLVMDSVEAWLST